LAKTWFVRPPVEPSDALQRVAGHPLVARLLAQRGLSDPDDAAGFLDPTQYAPASPWNLPGMQAAVALLREARDRGWAVRVWGDLDADGETATAVLVEALRAVGIAVLFDLPSRQEGHGLHRRRSAVPSGGPRLAPSCLPPAGAGVPRAGRAAGAHL